MNSNRIDLNLANVFIALWQERSVSKAAVRLNLTQPAISSALRRLRAVCDDQLFIRDGQGMSPTAHASFLAPSIEISVEILRNNLGSHTRFQPEQSTRRFVVGCDGGTEFGFGPSAMSQIINQAPFVSIVFRGVPFGRMGEELERREIELAVTASDVESLDCVSSPLGYFEFLAIWNPVACTLPATATLDDILSRRHVLLENAIKGSAVGKALHRAGLTRTIHTAVPSFGHLPFFLQEKETVAIIPDYIAYEMQRLGSFTTARLPTFIPGGQIRLHLHASRANEPGLLWLKDTIQSLPVWRRCKS